MSKGKHRRKLRRDRILEGSAGSPFGRTLLWSRAAAETLRETARGCCGSTVTAMILTQMLPAMLYLAWMDATLRVSGWMAVVLLLGVCFSLAAGVGLVSLMMPLLRRMIRWKTGLDVPLDLGRKLTILLLTAGTAGTVLCFAVMRL